MISLNLLIVNQYASTPKYSSGAGERHYYLARYFKLHDIQTTIISGGYNHLFHSNPIFKRHEKFIRECDDGVNLIWIKIRKYSAISGLGRVYSWFEFLFKLFRLKDIKRPDIIIVSSMSLLPALYAVYLKRKFKVPFILEVRDIWPLTFQELGNRSKYHPLVIILKMVEKYAYRHADSLVSVLPGFKSYLSKYFSGLDKQVYWIPNGISVDLLSHEKQKLIEEMLPDSQYFIVVYTGSLGVANSMIYLMEAAILLRNYDEIKFEILGDGYEKESLMQFKENNNLENVNFHSKILKEEVNDFIKSASICYHGCERSYLYTYGISPNKLNDYMLASKPIISSSGLENDPVIMANCGLVVASGNPRAIADGIIHIMSLEIEERMQMGMNGYDYLKANQSYEVLARKYLDVFNELRMFR